MRFFQTLTWNRVVISSSSRSYFSQSVLFSKSKILTEKYRWFWNKNFSMNSIGQISQSKKIAVCQMTSTGHKADNLSVVSSLIQQAAKEDAKMIFFPEACDYLCDNRKDMLSQAEPIVGGNLVSKYTELARTHNVWLSMGGLHEKDESNPNKVYNTHIVINNLGEIVQSYRKIHLFDVEIPEKNVRLKESDTALAGDHIVTPIQTEVGKIGLAICYDLRFPELSTQLADMGADILTYPSAFTYATGEAHWEILLRARAIETQCFVIAAAQVGQHNKKRRSYGHAMCVDPWGVVLATCGAKDDTPTFVCAQLDFARLADVRKNMPVFEHRRNDIYSLYALSLRQNLLPDHENTKDKISRSKSQESLQKNEPQTLYDGKLYDFGSAKIKESCVFYKTELSYAFVNLRCVVPGHVLVATMRKAHRLEDLTNDEAQDFFQTILTVQKLMEFVHNAKSTTVNIQDGPDAGQTIDHIHCHVMPRQPKDFKDNDLIYLELAKHDRRGRTAWKPPRSLTEMESEADILRQKMQKILKKYVLHES